MSGNVTKKFESTKGAKSSNVREFKQRRASSIGGMANNDQLQYNVDKGDLESFIENTQKELSAMDVEKYFDILRQDQRDAEKRHNESMSLIRDEMQASEQRTINAITKLESKLDTEVNRLETKIDKGIEETKESRKFFWTLAIPIVIALVSLVVQIMENVG